MVTKFVRINLFCTQGYIGIDSFIFVTKLKSIWLYILAFASLFKKQKPCIFESASRTGEIHIFNNGCKLQYSIGKQICECKQGWIVSMFT